MVNKNVNNEIHVLRKATVKEHSRPKEPDINRHRKQYDNRTNEEKNMVRAKSRECHNHKPQTFPDTKRKKKQK